MAYFFIDYENLSGRALEGISLVKFRKSDELIFFHNKTLVKISFELHKELEQIKAKKKYILVETGTGNALDFQLSSYLGNCISKSPDAQFYIVSKDRGFDCVCHFWQKRDIRVKRLEQLYEYNKNCSNVL